MDTEAHSEGRLGRFSKIEPEVLQASAPIVVKAFPVVSERTADSLS
jgi:hypothetical protein